MPVMQCKDLLEVPLASGGHSLVPLFRENKTGPSQHGWEQDTPGLPFPSTFPNCTGCLHLALKISGLEGRICTLYCIRGRRVSGALTCWL
uniref:Uncharacterized protein n=1 Tax=Anguilla anguilla TaxID=7936 RepID=A0A0E9XP12_ANGAN